MPNTDRFSLLERWANGAEAFRDAMETKYGPAPTPPQLPPYTTYDAMLEAIVDNTVGAKRLLNKKSPTYHSDSVAYVKTVPAGDVHYASLDSVGGRTLVWNQLVDSGTTSVATISGHKYYTLIDGTASIVTSSGSAITIVDDTADMVTDLTLCFGSGNEPTTVAEFQQMFPAQYYPYNAGQLLSAGVTEVVSKKADTTTLATYPIPTAIQQLEGYGWSAGSVYNYVDYERKVFVQCVKKMVLDGTQTLSVVNWRPTANGVGWSYKNNSDIKKTASATSMPNMVADKLEVRTINQIISYDYGIGINNAGTDDILIWQSDTSLTTSKAINNYLSNNPITIYVELNTPIETDISAYLTDDNLISVEAGGSLTFPNQHGDDYRIDVPSSVTFVVGET